MELVESYAEKHYILENFPGDEVSINHLATFRKSQIDKMSFFHFLANEKYNEEGIWGYSIEGVNLAYILESLNINEINPNSYPVSHIFNSKNPRGVCGGFCGTFSRPNFGKEEKIKAKKIVNTLFSELPISEDKLRCILTHEYALPLQIEYEYISDFLQERHKPKQEDDPFLRKEQLFSILVKNGKVPMKWKREYELFLLVARHFDDALFQYSPVWIRPMTYDIFIPSLKIAIEHQGIQHYRPVRHFGGDDGFERGKINDFWKVVKSQREGVRVIAWKYDEPITDELLEKKCLAYEVL